MKDKKNGNASNMTIVNQWFEPKDAPAKVPDESDTRFSVLRKEINLAMSS